MIRRFIGSDADRIGPPGEAIRIRAIGSDPRLITDQSDLLGALFSSNVHLQQIHLRFITELDVVLFLSNSCINDGRRSRIFIVRHGVSESSWKCNVALRSTTIDTAMSRFSSRALRVVNEISTHVLVLRT
jgi:hypothetical protein